MDQTAIEKELHEQRELIEKIFISVEKTRKYFLWTMWGTIILFVVPLIILAIALPMVMNTYLGSITGAGLGL
jgi:hypothetical protein